MREGRGRSWTRPGRPLPPGPAHSPAAARRPARRCHCHARGGAGQRRTGQHPCRGEVRWTTPGATISPWMKNAPRHPSHQPAARPSTLRRPTGLSGPERPGTRRPRQPRRAPALAARPRSSPLPASCCAPAGTACWRSPPRHPCPGPVARHSLGPARWPRFRPLPGECLVPAPKRQPFPPCRPGKRPDPAPDRCQHPRVETKQRTRPRRAAAGPAPPHQ